MDIQVSLFDRVFAVTIAFLLPGLAVLVGAATVNPVIVAWFGGASTNPSLVGFLFVALAALAIGLVVTSLRWFAFERIAWPLVGMLVKPSAPIDESKRREHYAEYEDLRFQHYYHYLASANMAVAVPIAVCIWLGWSDPFPAVGRVAIVVAFATVGIVILTEAAREAIARYCDRRLRLLGALPATP